MGWLSACAPGSKVTHQLQFYVKPLKGEIKKKMEERLLKQKKETSLSLNRQDCDRAQTLAHWFSGFIWNLSPW